MRKPSRKKGLIRFTVYAVFLSAICLGAAPVYGNSAPSYWEASPYSEVLAVDKNSPITVDRELLTFDFSKADEYDDVRNAMSPVGKVTADYQMTNPADDTLAVQMAFPFVANLYNLSVSDVTVNADGAAVPYKIYIDPNSINISGNAGEGFTSGSEGGFPYDYGSIGNISDQEWKLPGFDLDSEAKLYRFNVSGKEKPYLRFEVSFAADRGQTLLIGNGFDGAGYTGDRGELSCQIREDFSPEILVLGKVPEFTYAVLTDDGKKAEEDRYQLEIVQESVDPKAYLSAALRKEIGEDTAEAISDTQLFNLLLHGIWQDYLRNGFSVLFEAFSSFYEDRIFTLVYQVEFPAGSTRSVSVGYLTEGVMDRRETVSPKYSYTYLLSPAENWAGFGGLDVRIITPREAPYMIGSSLGLTRDGKNRYGGRFDGLPQSELTFTLYEKEKVTFIDKAEKTAYEFRYLLFFFRPVLIVILAVIAVFVARAVIRRKFRGKYGN